MAVPNFPQPPGRNGGGSTSCPSDLIASGRQYYTSINFVNYEFATATGGIGQVMSGGGSVQLPLPRKINDVETILWEEFSGSSAALQGVQGAAQRFLPQALQNATPLIVAGTQMAGIDYGVALNPFMFMMFKRPGFKEYSLHWTLAPNNQKDSDNLKSIITQCKKAALPQGYAGGGFLMKYPQIAMVSFKPDNYLFKLKPCAIISVAVDYTGANGPSFFKNGAPTVVNLSMQLKEMQLRDAQTAE